MLWMVTVRKVLKVVRIVGGEGWDIARRGEPG